jgi:C1A family cysteine protease
MPKTLVTDQSKYNWKRDAVDNRDHLFALSAASLPASIDLRAGCSPIEDQGQLGSCTGNAIAGLIEYIDRKNHKNLDVSRLFIYYQERLMEGTVWYDSGAYIRDGIKAVYQYGAPLESLWPYDARKLTVRPSYNAYTDAAKRKVKAYQRCANFAAVKTALAAGNPVVVGFDVYESFESDAVAATGVMPYPNVNTEQLLGGHAVTIVGYNDQHSWFIVRNSWGTSWGDHGYFYMPYQVIQDTNMSSDFWTITSVTNP